MSENLCRLAACVASCTLILAAGCGRQSEEAPVVQPEPPKIIGIGGEPNEPVPTETEPDKTTTTQAEPDKQAPKVTLTLKFTPDDVTTYKVATQALKSVLWEGPMPSKPSAFQGGHTSNDIEMTFTQQIQSVDDNGNATARITIKQLRYAAKVRDSVVLDFDSSSQQGQDSPLAKLIGQSYTIEITPSGQVSKVVDVSEVQAAVKGNTKAHRTAMNLISADVIEQRHTIPALPPSERNQVSVGESWNNLKTFNFGMMGSKTYERVYELEEIKDPDGERIAITEMNAVPSSEGAAELHKDQPGGFLSKLFDNTEEYSGQLKLDLTAGKVDNYVEKLRSEWLAVDPESAQDDDKAPAALRMTAVRAHQIERID